MTGHLILPLGGPISGAYVELFIILGYSLIVTTAYVMTRKTLQQEQQRNEQLTDVLEKAAARHPDVKDEAAPYLERKHERL